jgi:hypothetical protein
MPITIDTASCPQLQQHDWVYLEAAVMAALDGQLDSLLVLFSRIDKWIEGERLRLQARYPHKKIAWRACMFTAIYCHPIAIDVSNVRELVQAGRAARLWRSGKDGYHRIAAILANHPALSPGQLYFLIEEFSSSQTTNAPSPPFLYGLAQQAWRLGIYHLRLVTAHMLIMEAHHVREEERVQLVKLAGGWLSEDSLLNSIVIDVLKAFGALHGEFTPQQASAEFKKVIEAPLSQGICEQAFELYGRLFDHPYDESYCEAFYELNAAMRTKLLARAAFTEATWSFSFSILVGELAKNPAAETIPALQRVALAPKQDTPSVQDSVSTFVSAVTALARLRAPLPEDPPVIDSIQMAWRHARHIVYSLHRPGITREDYTAESEPFWKMLHELHAIDVAMRIVHNRWQDDDDTASRLLDWSSSQLLSLCRDAIVSERKPFSSLERLRRYSDLSREHIEFALATIEAHGNRSDLPILTALLDNPIHGNSAIRAARAIESR